MQLLNATLAELGLAPVFSTTKITLAREAGALSRGVGALVLTP